MQSLGLTEIKLARRQINMHPIVPFNPKYILLQDAREKLLLIAIVLNFKFE